MSETNPKRPNYTQISRPHKGIDVQVRQQERRLKLIEAGLETLGTKGYHASTVRDVCSQAGLSERYFYESFSGLSDLFTTIYQNIHVEWLGRLMVIFVSARGQQSDPLETAQAALTAWFSYLQEDARRARIMLLDAMGANDQTVLAATRDYVGAIQTLIELLYSQLTQQSLSPRLLASIVSGACIHAAKEWIRSGFEPPLDTVVRHLMLVIRGLDIQYHQGVEATASPPQY
jgi:AcrR family transcriptional regulator